MRRVLTVFLMVAPLSVSARPVPMVCVDSRGEQSDVVVDVEKNVFSIDGLPGELAAHGESQALGTLVEPDGVMWAILVDGLSDRWVTATAMNSDPLAGMLKCFPAFDW
ncbi:hypothetical protein [Pseudoroseicyclus aestuarii]|uniref:Uncharacterized protein n=1 Tax=Pseudoroseicyclus aestuarii TaxID=1795041 RepID=A0A318T3P6_9RHOB|nr:hypothetical protein [Pseudoroseicyclus aestuarii]PYE81168.1 hypothetical protein DFP88_10811 [Pseudoroseicyclus aestuarii]